MAFDPSPKALCNHLCDGLIANGRSDWVQALREPLEDFFLHRPHGRLAEWLDCVAALPEVPGARLRCEPSVVAVGTARLSDEQHSALKLGLTGLVPWRKGPFDWFGLSLDAEWRCDLKWRRLADAIDPLVGRRVLDVGAGNGWYSFQMLAAGAREVLAVDPMALFHAQFLAMARYLQGSQLLHLPLPGELLPANSGSFDTVFSMGVLYHRRSPIDHLADLRGHLRPGGQLVLETLVIEGGLGEVLVPLDRYARMRNVWFIPSVATLERWLARLGYVDVQLLDVTPTLPEEQRVTAWSGQQSLADFLDPMDHTRTVEGDPAPLRASLLARRA